MIHFTVFLHFQVKNGYILMTVEFCSAIYAQNMVNHQSEMHLCKVVQATRKTA